MGFITASVLDAEDFEYSVVDCPEWGGQVRVRGLSAGQQSRITQRVTDKETEDVMVLTCIYGCVDEEGMPIFTLKDKDALRKKNGKVIKRIFEEIVRLSGTDAEEAKKNSSETGKDDLP